jgi:mitochondrial import inner membrane translocase subunit TIM44
MLPRHLRRTLPAHTTHRLLATPSCQHAPPLAGLRYRPTAGSVATFHHTSRRNDELPKSPFQTFVDVLREELRKNRELQENVKQLQGDVDKFQDSEAMRKARAAYEHARVRGILGTRVFFPRIVDWVRVFDFIAHVEYQREPAVACCR